MYFRLIYRTGKPALFTTMVLCQVSYYSINMSWWETTSLMWPQKPVARVSPMWGQTTVLPTDVDLIKWYKIYIVSINAKRVMIDPFLGQCRTEKYLKSSGQPYTCYTWNPGHGHIVTFCGQWPVILLGSLFPPYLVQSEVSKVTWPTHWTQSSPACDWSQSWSSAGSPVCETQGGHPSSGHCGVYGGVACLWLNEDRQAIMVHTPLMNAVVLVDGICDLTWAAIFFFFKPSIAGMVQRLPTSIA